MRVWRVFPLLIPLLAGGCSSAFLPEAPSWAGAKASLPGLARASNFATGAGFEADPDAAEGELRLRLGLRRASATLVQDAAGRQLWRTRAGVVVALAGPRVVGTAGLGQAVAGTRFDGPDPLEDPRALLGRRVEARRQVDLLVPEREAHGNSFGITLRCTLHATPLPEDAGFLVVEERCRSGSVEGFTNRFWADAESGQVLRSEQWIGPELPMLGVQPHAPGAPPKLNP